LGSVQLIARNLPQSGVPSAPSLPLLAASRTATQPPPAPNGNKVATIGTVPPQQAQHLIQSLPRVGYTPPSFQTIQTRANAQQQQKGDGPK